VRKHNPAVAELRGLPGPLIRQTLALPCSLLFIRAAAFGQAAIAGSVSDPSGAEVPGVAIVATSEALIETSDEHHG
jgi:hypothetical protein